MTTRGFFQIDQDIERLASLRNRLADELAAAPPKKRLREWGKDRVLAIADFDAKIGSLAEEKVRLAISMIERSATPSSCCP